MGSRASGPRFASKGGAVQTSWRLLHVIINFHRDSFILCLFAHIPRVANLHGPYL